jgi:cation:H+ antiporter
MTEPLTPIGPVAFTKPAPAASPGRVLAFLIAIALTLPGLFLRLSGTHPNPPWIGAIFYGLAVVGAAFVLAWGAEVIQLDVSAGFALALLALIAVLPEYAVDFVFTWKAGSHPKEFAPLALANMTGANRLLIGVGWSMVVLIAAWRIKRKARAEGYEGEVDTEVHLDRPHAVEIAFLAAACLYSLTLALDRDLSLADAAVLVALFVAYLIRIMKAPAEEPHLVGPAAMFGALSTTKRRIAVGLMFAFAAGVILAAADPFAENLVASGKDLGISTFVLVQWLAPLASEAPELLIAGLFAWRLNTSGALGTLVSSKVNQWTLLVGTLPIVFAIASHSMHGLPLDTLQHEELFLTAAQSVFAVSVLANRSLSVREAYLLFGLFISQFVLGGVLPDNLAQFERLGVGVVYLILAVYLLVKDRDPMRRLLRDGFFTPMDELIGDDPALVGQVDDLSGQSS